MAANGGGKNTAFSPPVSNLYAHYGVRYFFVILLESVPPTGYDVGGSSAVHAKMPCPENGSRKKKPTKTGWPVHGLGEKRRAARQLRLAKNDCS